MMEITPTRSIARFQALDDVQREESGVTTIADFVVENGRPGVVRGA